MKKTAKLTLGALALFTSTTIIAQNITGPSTLGYLPKFSNTSSTAPAVVNSQIFDSQVFGSTFVSIGNSSPLSGEYFSIQRPQNAATAMRIFNSTSGTTATSNYIATVPASSGYLSTSMIACSAGYTSNGMFQAGTGVFNSTGIMNIGTNTSNPLNFWTNNIQRMALNGNNGYLGILMGTTAAQYPLDVAGDVHNTGYFYSGTMTGNYLKMGYDGVNSVIYSTGTPLLLNYNNGQDVSVCGGSSGAYLTIGKNVEIGSPTRDVTTALNLRANGTTTALKITNSSNASVFQVAATGNITMFQASHIDFNGGDGFHGLGIFGGTPPGGGSNPNFNSINVNGPVLFGYGGGALATTGTGQKIALQWDAAGKIYIGAQKQTSNGHQGALLQVNGDVVVGSNGSGNIWVTQANWADFVFDANYNLMSLNEVENFYKTNHHLPNVPTTKEIQAEGNNLGQTDAVLLQKIEELTLYMVKQQKQLETQQQLIETLTKKVSEKK